METVRVGLVGSGFITAIHAEALRRVPGVVQEMEHFVTCVREGRTPAENGHDGRAVLEAIFALYASAGQQRRISLPFVSDAARPIDLWRPR
jgi:predicted dehydrogenase